MARTYEKRSKMDMEKDFPTFLALDELEFFDEPIVLGNDDVFVTDLKNQDGGDFSEGAEILEEFNLQGGEDFLGTNWFTDKIDFNTFDPTLAGTSETLEQLTKVEETQLPSSFLEETELLQVLQDSYIPGTEMFPTPVEIPTTPEQKVPDYQALSPYSSTSTSFIADESNPPSPCSVSSISSSGTLDNVTIRDLLMSSSQSTSEQSVSNVEDSTTKGASMEKPKVSIASPYSCEKPKPYTVQSKVKTPAQRQRKRVQNKDAATRYRVKKKDEQSRLNEEAEVLEKENSELKDQVNSIKKEIEYLKNLMIEVYKTKQKQKQATLHKK